jgi:hypothetical protein
MVSNVEHCQECADNFRLDSESKKCVSCMADFDGQRNCSKCSVDSFTTRGLSNEGVCGVQYHCKACSAESITLIQLMNNNSGLSSGCIETADCSAARGLNINVTTTNCECAN